LKPLGNSKASKSKRCSRAIAATIFFIAQNRPGHSAMNRGLNNKTLSFTVANGSIDSWEYANYHIETTGTNKSKMK
jgi:hypothetical protein